MDNHCERQIRGCLHPSPESIDGPRPDGTELHDRPPRPDRSADRGQAALVVVVVAAVLLVAVVSALAVMGRTAIDRTRAQTAADAAALAALDGGRGAADELATAHGATVMEWVRGPGPNEVTVTVRLGDTTATARASNAP